jgi:hypothetical protein
MGLVARVVRRLEETMPDEARLQPDEEAFEFIWANFFPHNLREEVEPVISSSPAWVNAHRALSLFITYQRQRKPHGLANPKKFEGSPASDIVSESRDF